MIDEEDEVVRRLSRKRVYMRVTFPNGKTICSKNITEVMINTLKEIGSSKFEYIRLQTHHLPLICQETHPLYKEWMMPICDGWYYNTSSTNCQKYLQLRYISDQLWLGLKIEIFDDLDQEHKKCKKSKSNDNILVTLPDGEYVANDSPIDTYIETIWEIGIEDVKRKGLSFGDDELITFTQQSKNQVQVDTDRWLYVPNSTKDKVKVLRVIAAMLHIKLEVTII